MGSGQVESVQSQLSLTEKAHSAALKGRMEEHEAYISEIEAIGGVCEDMQNQNARLLQQLTDRDEYASSMVSYPLLHSFTIGGMID
jgi:hypothetical protein